MHFTSPNATGKPLPRVSFAPSHIFSAGRNFELDLRAFCTTPLLVQTRATLAASAITVSLDTLKMDVSLLEGVTFSEIPQLKGVSCKDLPLLNHLVCKPTRWLLSKLLHWVSPPPEIQTVYVTVTRLPKGLSFEGMALLDSVTSKARPLLHSVGFKARSLLNGINLEDIPLLDSVVFKRHAAQWLHSDIMKWMNPPLMTTPTRTSTTVYAAVEETTAVALNNGTLASSVRYGDGFRELGTNAIWGSLLNINDFASEVYNHGAKAGFARLNISPILALLMFLCVLQGILCIIYRCKSASAAGDPRRNINTLADLSLENAELLDNNTRLQSDNSDLECKNSKLKCDNASLLSEKDELSRDFAKLKSLYETLLHQNEETKDKNSKLFTLKTDLERINQELTSKATDAKCESEKMSSEKAELAGKNKELSDETDRMKELNNALSLKNEGMDKDNTVLVKTNRSVSKENGVLQKKVKNAEAENEELTEQLKEFSGLKEALAQSEREKEDIKGKSSEFENRLNESLQATELLSSKNSELQNRLTESQEKTHTTSEVLQMTQGALIQAEEEKRAADTKAREDAAVLTEDLQACEAEVGSLRRTLEAGNADLEQQHEADIAKLKRTSAFVVCQMVMRHDSALADLRQQQSHVVDNLSKQLAEAHDALFARNETIEGEATKNWRKYHNLFCESESDRKAALQLTAAMGKEKGEMKDRLKAALEECFKLRSRLDKACRCKRIGRPDHGSDDDDNGEGDGKGDGAGRSQRRSQSMPPSYNRRRPQTLPSRPRALSQGQQPQYLQSTAEKDDPVDNDDSPTVSDTVPVSQDLMPSQDPSEAQRTPSSRRTLAQSVNAPAFVPGAQVMPAQTLSAQDESMPQNQSLSPPQSSSSAQRMPLVSLPPPPQSVAEAIASPADDGRSPTPSLAMPAAQDLPPPQGRLPAQKALPFEQGMDKSIWATAADSETETVPTQSLSRAPQTMPQQHSQFSAQSVTNAQRTQSQSQPPSLSTTTPQSTPAPQNSLSQNTGGNATAITTSTRKQYKTGRRVRNRQQNAAAAEAAAPGSSAGIQRNLRWNQRTA